MNVLPGVQIEETPREPAEHQKFKMWEMKNRRNCAECGGWIDPMIMYIYVGHKFDVTDNRYYHFEKCMPPIWALAKEKEWGIEKKLWSGVILKVRYGDI